MPRIPKEILGAARLVKRNTTKYLYTYGVIGVLVIELLSLVICELSDNYLYFWYPILTQLISVIFMLSIICTPPRVAPCIRKKVAMYCLVSYYSYGTICILFNISNDEYEYFIKYGLLLSSLYILINTIIRKK